MFLSTGLIQNSTWGYASRLIKDTNGVDAPGFTQAYGAYSLWTLAPNGWLYRVPSANDQNNVHAMRPGSGNLGRVINSSTGQIITNESNYDPATVAVLAPNGTTRPNIPASNGNTHNRYFHQGIVAKNGLIYFIPMRNRHMIVLNPNSGADPTWEIIDLTTTPCAQYPSTTPVEVQCTGCAISANTLTVGSITNGQTLARGMNLANISGAAITEYTLNASSTPLTWSNAGTGGTYSTGTFTCTAGFYVTQNFSASSPTDNDTFTSARLGTDGNIYLVSNTNRRLMRIIPRATVNGTDVFQMGYYNATTFERHITRVEGPFTTIPGTSPQLLYGNGGTTNTAKQAVNTSNFKFWNAILSPYNVGSEIHRRIYLVPSGSNWMFYINPNLFGSIDEFGVVTPSGSQTALSLNTLGYDESQPNNAQKGSSIKFGAGILGFDKRAYLPPRSYNKVTNFINNNLNKVVQFDPLNVALSQVSDNAPNWGSNVFFNGALMRNGYVIATHFRLAADYSVLQIDTNPKLITAATASSTNSATITVGQTTNISIGNKVIISSIANQEFTVVSFTSTTIVLNSPISVSAGAIVTVLGDAIIYNLDGSARNIPIGTTNDSYVSYAGFKSLAGTDVSNKGKMITCAVNNVYGSEIIAVKNYYPGVTHFNASTQDDAKFAFPANLNNLPFSEYNLYNNGL